VESQRSATGASVADVDQVVGDDAEANQALDARDKLRRQRRYTSFASAAGSLTPYRYELSRAIDVAILTGNQDRRDSVVKRPIV
jgi:hypothetical protein